MSARGKVRNPRKAALMDALYAELSRADAYLAIHDLQPRFPTVSYLNLYNALERLHREKRIVKVRHPLLKHALWGHPARPRGSVIEFAHLTEHVQRMRAALEGAPVPVGPCVSWEGEYETWWNGPRRDALSAP